jgi:hypothetical protein
MNIIKHILNNNYEVIYIHILSIIFLLMNINNMKIILRPDKNL